MLPRNMQLFYCLQKSDHINMHVTRQKLNMYKIYMYMYVCTNIKNMSLSVVECWNELVNDIKFCNNCRLFSSNLKYFHIIR